MVAGHRGASGQAVRGRVGLESRAPKETVITQCKFYFSAKNTLKCYFFLLFYN